MTKKLTYRYAFTLLKMKKAEGRSEYIDLANNIRDFAILSKLSPWDHISGILLLREAGGFDSYFNGNYYNHCLDKKNLVVANNDQLGKQILSIIKE